jgi:hypothetical protein
MQYENDVDRLCLARPPVTLPEFLLAHFLVGLEGLNNLLHISSLQW